MNGEIYPFFCLIIEGKSIILTPVILLFRKSINYDTTEKKDGKHSCYTGRSIVGYRLSPFRRLERVGIYFGLFPHHHHRGGDCGCHLMDFGDEQGEKTEE